MSQYHVFTLFRDLYICPLSLSSCQWKQWQVPNGHSIVRNNFLSLGGGGDGTSVEGIWYRDKIVLQWCKNWSRVFHVCFWFTAINPFTSVFHCTGCCFLLCFIFVMNCCQRHYLYTFYLFCDGMSLNLGLIVALLFAVNECVLNEAVILHMLQPVDVRRGGIL